MKRTLFLIFLSLNLSAFEVSFKRELEKEGIRKLYYSVKSNFEKKEIVPFFVYAPVSIDEGQSLKPILFLHGRGFSRNLSSDDGMLDFVDLKKVFKKKAFKNAIFIAPQDIFLHEDSQSAGQDYWMGIEGRNWSKFLSSDFNNLRESIREKLQAKEVASLETVVGISMGAHGALMLGEHHPQHFKKVVALSPVFRPVYEEIIPNDRDVFRPEDKSYSLRNNIGAKILEGTYHPPKDLQVFISRGDFALDKKNFPKGHETFMKLLNEHGPRHTVRIIEDDLGHSMKFWNKAFLLIE